MQFKHRSQVLVAALVGVGISTPLLAQEGSIPANAADWRGIARLKLLKTSGKIKGKSYSLEGQYPVFFARTRLTRFANQKLKQYATSNYSKFLADTKRDMPKDPPLAGGYEYDSGAVLSTYAPNRLISLSMGTYRYMGGAHGLGLSDAINYAIINGKPKELSLGDLFTPGTPYRSRVEKLIFAKLKKNENAMWVHDGTVKTLTTEQFNNFTVEKDGLEWTFNPYEMGPYAVGPITVKLSPGELGTGLKRTLLWGK